MSKDDIKEIEGVWTKEEVNKIKSWASSESRTTTIKESLENSQVQSKIIEKMAIVDPKNLKEPFTYIIE
jgi:hypothetical protein